MIIICYCLCVVLNSFFPNYNLCVVFVFVVCVFVVCVFVVCCLYILLLFVRCVEHFFQYINFRIVYTRGYIIDNYDIGALFTFLIILIFEI